MKTTENTTTKKYSVGAWSNSTDLGTIGSASTLSGAVRIGRSAVLGVSNGEGKYRVYDDEGREVLVGERSIRTGFKWVETDGLGLLTSKNRKN